MTEDISAPSPGEAARYRQIASVIRDLLPMMTVLEARNALLTLAVQYEQLAQHAEASAAQLNLGAWIHL